MSISAPELVLVTQAWSNSVNYPFVKFWCRNCDQKVFGFPEIFPDFFTEEKFHCPICGALWSDLEPVFHGEFEIIFKNNPIKGESSQQITGVSINLVMGMTVTEYLDIGERIGYDRLGFLSRKYFVGSEFELIPSKQNGLPYSLQLPKGNCLSFQKWLTLQVEYEQFDLHELLYGKFDEDDGFIGNEE